MPKTIVVLGARNLGGAIIDHFQAHGWQAAAVGQKRGHARRRPATEEPSR